MDFESRVELAYRTVLEPGDFALDIGAHRGRHTVPMAQTVGVEGRIWAFEPLPTARLELHSALENARGAGGLADVHVRPEALSHRTGFSPYVFVSNWPEYSGLRERVYDAEVELKSLQVQTLRLDDALEGEPRIRLIKVDAEGGEYDILRGGAGRLASDRPVILFEFGDHGITGYPEVTSALMAELLIAADFDLFDILGRPLDREAFVRSSDEQSVWDYAAVPTEAGDVRDRLLEALTRAS
ncbi:MAG: FkbM family methyltransferase [Acidobacteriota bacterium]